MKRTTIFISTAALMAGTACGVWAESNDTFSSSFDRMERSIYDSNINYKPSPHMADEIGTLYSSASTGYAKRSDAYAPDTTRDNTDSNGNVAGATGEMNEEDGTENPDRTLTGNEEYDENTEEGERTIDSGGNNVTKDPDLMDTPEEKMPDENL